MPKTAPEAFFKAQYPVYVPAEVGAVSVTLNSTEPPGATLSAGKDCVVPLICVPL